MQNEIDSYQSRGGSLIELKGELCWCTGARFRNRLLVPVEDSCHH